MCTDTHNMQTCGNLGKRMMISSYILGIGFFYYYYYYYVRIYLLLLLL